VLCGLFVGLAGIGPTSAQDDLESLIRKAIELADNHAYADAEAAAASALKRAEQQQPYNFADVSVALHACVNIYSYQGKHELAEQAASRKVAIVKRACQYDRKRPTLGHGDEKIGWEWLFLPTALNCLGQVYLDTKRPAEAESLFRESEELLRLLGKAQDSDYADTLGHLANAYESQNKPALAITVLGRAAVIYNTLGEEHITDTVDTMRRMAELFEKTGNLEEQRCYEQLADNLERAARAAGK